MFKYRLYLRAMIAVCKTSTLVSRDVVQQPCRILRTGHCTVNVQNRTLQPTAGVDLARNTTKFNVWFGEILTKIVMGFTDRLIWQLAE